MANYISDGKKLMNVEYDDIPQINDTVDSIRVLSSDKRAEDDNALFLLKLVKWCDRRDLNPHTVRHEPLKPACLPFHHDRIV